MIACDIDGTLLNYGGGPAVVNFDFLYRLRRSLGIAQIGIATNQGGLPFGWAGVRNGTGSRYPAPAEFCGRLGVLLSALDQVGLRVSGVRICVFHPKAAPADVQGAARQVRDGLFGLGVADWRVFTVSAARKPAGLMLRSLAPTGLYYGDSQEDQAAAAAAGWDFVRVEQFGGGA